MIRTRRAVLAGLLSMSLPTPSPARTERRAVVAGADVLVRSGFSVLEGKRVGLIANHTSLVGDAHLADVVAAAPGVELAAILAPEHGFRGAVEAGAAVRNDTDARTGVRVFSLYGDTRKPTPAMLRGIDLLVFDIQDIGTRFYTYISTMGLAMQAAAAARIPFVVLDRPNPLGGDYVSGFVLDPALRSFVGQYPIPIVHGMTIAELAWMIRGESWLDGVGAVELQAMKMEGWSRAMRWPSTGRGWVATSPNIPSFEAALLYPGTGIVGELEVSEGRGTPTPFSLVAAPWLDAGRLIQRISALHLPGLRFEPARYTPHPVPGVAADPRFAGRPLDGVRLVVTDPDRVEPLEAGIHMLAEIAAQAKSKGVARLYANPAMFDAIAGTRRLHQMLASGSTGAAIVAAWSKEAALFKTRRARYLLY